MFHHLKEALINIENRRNKHSLEDFRGILDREGIKDFPFKVMHITGTNGKGSTLNYSRAILSELGYKVGTFSSPYMIKHNDRICIQGKMIDDDRFLKLINTYYPIIERYDLSMFEIDVLLMLVYFKEEAVDYAIVEVGIGGLKDKTNVVWGNVNVITSIGEDHLGSIGPTLKEVTINKAGIIKEGSKTVIGNNLDKEYIKIIEDKCQEVKSECIVCDIPLVKDYPYCFTYEGFNITLNDVGVYQINNFILAMNACLMMSDRRIDQDLINKVTKNTFLVGRFERIGDLYLDGAHNIDGIKSLIESIYFINKDKEVIVGVIFSALADKNYQQMISLLIKEGFLVVVCRFIDERALNENDLSFDENVVIKKDFNEAYDYLLSKELDVLVVTGSLHFISDVRKHIIE